MKDGVFARGLRRIFRCFQQKSAAGVIDLPAAIHPHCSSQFLFYHKNTRRARAHCEEFSSSLYKDRARLVGSASRLWMWDVSSSALQIRAGPVYVWIGILGVQFAEILEAIAPV